MKETKSNIFVGFLIVNILSIVGCSPDSDQRVKEEALSVPMESSSVSTFSFGENLEVGAVVSDKIFTFIKNPVLSGAASSNVSLSNTTDFSLVSASGCNRELIKTTDKCVVKVRFLKNKVSGSYSGELHVGDGIESMSVSLSASVVSPIAISSLSVLEGSSEISSVLSFGPLNSSASLSKIITIKNEGTQAEYMSVSLMGEGFSILSNSCSSSLAKNKTCSIKVSFKAGASGVEDIQKLGTLSLNNQKSISLSATILGVPVVTGSPDVRFYDSSSMVSSINMGSIASGSVSKIIVLKNEGTASSPAPSLSGDSSFSIISSSCSGTLLSGKNCSMKISFSAVGSGSKTATISSGGANLIISGSITTQSSEINPQSFTLLDDYYYESEGSGNGGNCEASMGGQLVARFVFNYPDPQVQESVQNAICQYLQEQKMTLNQTDYEYRGEQHYGYSPIASTQISMYTGTSSYLINQGYWDFSVGMNYVFDSYYAYSLIRQSDSFTSGGAMILTDGEPRFLTKFQDSVYYGVRAAKPVEEYFIMRKLADDSVQRVGPNYRVILNESHTNFVLFKNKMYMIVKDGSSYKLVYIDSQQNGFSVFDSPLSLSQNAKIIANDSYLLLADDSSFSKVVVITDNFNYFEIDNNLFDTFDNLGAGDFIGSIYYGIGITNGVPTLRQIDLINRTITLTKDSSNRNLSEVMVLGKNGGKLWLMSYNSPKQMISIDNQGQVNYFTIDQSSIGNRYYSKDVIYYNTNNKFYRIQNGNLVDLGIHGEAYYGAIIAPDGSLIYNEYTDDGLGGSYLFHIRRLAPSGVSTRIKSQAMIMINGVSERLVNYNRFLSSNIIGNKIVVMGAEIDNYGSSSINSMFMIDVSNFSVSKSIAPCGVGGSGDILGRNVDSYLTDGRKMYLGARSCSVDTLELHKFE